MGERRKVRRSSVPDLEGKRSFGRTRSRWNGNNKMDIKEIMWENVAWIYLAQDGGKWRAVMETQKNNQLQFETRAVY
jgi:hypothetical protein